MAEQTKPLASKELAEQVTAFSTSLFEKIVFLDHLPPHYCTEYVCY